MFATTVSSGDVRIRALRLPPGFGPLGRLIFGFKGPRQPVLGSELSGIVTTVGDKVTAFQPGDAIIAFPDTRLGAHAEYVTIPETGLIVAKPDSLSFEAAAALCFSGLTAWDYLRKAALKSDERLLVIGASGSVGSAFVQLAKARGAQVTAVTSAANAETVQSLGADDVIDYGHQDFTAIDQKWDVIADTVAASRFADCLPVLNEGGRYLAIAGGLSEMFTRPKGSRRSIAGPAQAKREDLVELVRLVEAGSFAPLVDSIHAFEAMSEAHSRTDTGRKRGAVVVRGPDHSA